LFGRWERNVGRRRQGGIEEKKGAREMFQYEAKGRRKR
jgi:hypothetical protein